MIRHTQGKAHMDMASQQRVRKHRPMRLAGKAVSVITAFVLAASFLLVGAPGMPKLPWASFLQPQEAYAATPTWTTKTGSFNYPYGVACSSDGQRVYVANYSNDTVSYSTNGGSSWNKINTQDPQGVACSSDGQYVFVANYTQQSVSYSTSYGGSWTTKMGSFSLPEAAACSSDGKYVYIANASSANKTLAYSQDYFSTCKNFPDVGFNYTQGVACSSNGQRVFVTNFGDDSVLYSINGGSNWTKTKAGNFNCPQGIACSQDGKYVYVTNNGNSSISYSTNYGIDSWAYTLPNTPAGEYSRPVDVACSSDGKYVYVANEYKNSVSYSMDYGSSWAITTVGNSNGSKGIACSSNGGLVYVTNYNNNSVSIGKFIIPITSATIGGITPSDPMSGTTHGSTWASRDQTATLSSVTPSSGATIGSGNNATWSTSATYNSSTAPAASASYDDVQHFKGDTPYYAHVTLAAASGYTFSGFTKDMVTAPTGWTCDNVHVATDGSTCVVTLKYTTAARSYTQLESKTAPKLTGYKSGDALDLTSAVLWGEYDDYTYDTPAYNASSVSWGYTDRNATTNQDGSPPVSISNASELLFTMHNGKYLVATYTAGGVSHSVVVGQLSVTMASGALSVSMDSWTYGASASAPSVSGTLATDTISADPPPEGIGTNNNIRIEYYGHAYAQADAADATTATGTPYGSADALIAACPVHAGSYTVVATPIGDTDNYTAGDTVATATFQIKKAAQEDITLSASSYDLTFAADNSTAPTLSRDPDNGSTGVDNISWGSYSSSDEGVATIKEDTGAITLTGAGSFTASAVCTHTVSDGGTAYFDYAEYTATTPTITVNPDTFTYKVPSGLYKADNPDKNDEHYAQWTYDGHTHAPSVYDIVAATGTNPDDFKVMYSTLTDKEKTADELKDTYTRTSPDTTDAGEYTIYFEISRAGYTTVYDSYEVNVSKAKANITWPSAEGVTYPTTLEGSALKDGKVTFSEGTYPAGDGVAEGTSLPTSDTYTNSFVWEDPSTIPQVDKNPLSATPGTYTCLLSGIDTHNIDWSGSGFSDGSLDGKGEYEPATQTHSAADVKREAEVTVTPATATLTWKVDGTPVSDLAGGSDIPYDTQSHTLSCDVTALVPTDAPYVTFTDSDDAASPTDPLTQAGVGYYSATVATLEDTNDNYILPEDGLTEPWAIVPSAPKAPTVSGVDGGLDGAGDHTIDLSWTELPYPTQTGGVPLASTDTCGADAYTIEWAKATEDTSGTLTPPATGTDGSFAYPEGSATVAKGAEGANDTYTIEGLSSGKAYYFHVRAINFYAQAKGTTPSCVDGAWSALSAQPIAFAKDDVTLSVVNGASAAANSDTNPIVLTYGDTLKDALGHATERAIAATGSEAPPYTVPATDVTSRGSWTFSWDGSDVGDGSTTMPTVADTSSGYKELTLTWTETPDTSGQVRYNPKSITIYIYVSKATLTVTDTQDVDTQYDGGAHTVAVYRIVRDTDGAEITPGDRCTVAYSTLEEAGKTADELKNTYTLSSPTFYVDAGTDKTVYWRVSGDYDDYETVYGSGTVHITKRVIDYSWCIDGTAVTSPASVPYNAQAHTVTCSIDNLVGADDVSIDITGDLTKTGVDHTGAYTATFDTSSHSDMLSGTSAKNYTMPESPEGLTWNVSPYELSLDWSGVTFEKTYEYGNVSAVPQGGAGPSGGPSLAGVYATDEGNVSLDTQDVTFAYDDYHAGSAHTITQDGSYAIVDTTGNYVLSENPYSGSGVIAKVALTSADITWPSIAYPEGKSSLQYPALLGEAALQDGSVTYSAGADPAYASGYDFSWDSAYASVRAQVQNTGYDVYLSGIDDSDYDFTTAFTDGSVGASGKYDASTHTIKKTYAVTVSPIAVDIVWTSLEGLTATLGTPVVYGYDGVTPYSVSASIDNLAEGDDTDASAVSLTGLTWTPSLPTDTATPVGTYIATASGLKSADPTDTTYTNYTLQAATSLSSDTDSATGTPIATQKTMRIDAMEPASPVLSLDTTDTTSLTVHWTLPEGARTGGRPIEAIELSWSDGYSEQDMSQDGFEPVFTTTYDITSGDATGAWSSCAYTIGTGITSGKTYFVHAKVKNGTGADALWSEYSYTVSGITGRATPVIVMDPIVTDEDFIKVPYDGTPLEDVVASGEVASHIESIEGTGGVDLWDSGTDPKGTLAFADGTYVPTGSDDLSAVFPLTFTVTDESIAQSYNVATVAVRIKLTVDTVALSQQVTSVHNKTTNIDDLTSWDSSKEDYGVYKDGAWDTSAWPNLIGAYGTAKDVQAKSGIHPLQISQPDVDGATDALTYAASSMVPSHPLLDASGVPISPDVYITSSNAGQPIRMEWKGDYYSAVASSHIKIGAEVYTLNYSTVTSPTTGSGIDNSQVPASIDIRDSSGDTIGTLSPGSAIITLSAGFANTLADKSDIAVTAGFSDVVSQSQEGTAVIHVDREAQGGGGAIVPGTGGTGGSAYDVGTGATGTSPQTGDTLALLLLACAEGALVLGLFSILCAVVKRKKGQKTSLRRTPQSRRAR